MAIDLRALPLNFNNLLGSSYVTEQIWSQEWHTPLSRLQGTPPAPFPVTTTSRRT
jgi:hypothetical protein